MLPEHSVSFSGKTKGVIAEASIPKYQPGQFTQFRHGDKANLPEIAAVNAHDRGCLGVDRLLKIAQMGAIGGAHFYQLCATLP